MDTSSLANATSYLPSPADLLLAFPRLLSKAGSFAEHFDSVFGKIRSGGSIIAEPTASNVTNATVATTGTFVQESIAAAASIATGGSGDDISMFQALKNIGSFFTYITSKWAIATFTTVSLILRRVTIARIHMRDSSNRVLGQEDRSNASGRLLRPWSGVLHLGPS